MLQVNSGIASKQTELLINNSNIDWHDTNIPALVHEKIQ